MAPGKFGVGAEGPGREPGDFRPRAEELGRPPGTQQIVGTKSPISFVSISDLTIEQQELQMEL